MAVARMRWLACVAGCLMLVSGGCFLLPSSERSLVKTMRTGPTAEARRAALMELSDRARPWMRPELEATLRGDVDPTNRALAARILGRMGLPEAADALRRTAQADVNWVVRQRALAALARLLGADAAADIERAARQDPQPEVRMAALELGRDLLSADPARFKRLLREALSDTSAAVRLRAGALLARLESGN